MKGPPLSNQDKVKEQLLHAISDCAGQYCKTEVDLRGSAYALACLLYSMFIILILSPTSYVLRIWYSSLEANKPC